MAETTTVRFVGVDGCMPAVGGETACFLINDTVLVDCGWNAALSMKRFGCDPMALTHLLITHCHQDHFLGLAPLLFYRAMMGLRLDGGAPTLTIAGPRTEIGMAVDRAIAYIQADRHRDFPLPVELVPLAPGAGCEAGRLQVTSAPGIHPAIDLSYRFEDTATGASVVITGDTAYHPSLARFATGVDVLIHDSSYGAQERDPLLPGGHSGAPDAARIAREAGVGRLCLVHCPEGSRAAALAAALEVFPESYAPSAGDVIELGKS